MDSPVFDLNNVTDVLVPIYSVVALLLIFAYHRSPEKKLEERYFLKKVAKSSQKKNWREMMTGYFHQGESDGFDDWLKFLGKPYPIRIIAPKMFHKINFEMKLTDTNFSVERDGGNKDKVDLKFNATLGTSEENAPRAKNDGEDAGEWQAWVEEGEEKLHTKFTPSNPSSGPTIHNIRRMEDEDTIVTQWHGVFKGKTCEMTSTLRRL